MLKPLMKLANYLDAVGEVGLADVLDVLFKRATRHNLNKDKELQDLLEQMVIIEDKKHREQKQEQDRPQLYIEDYDEPLETEQEPEHKHHEPIVIDMACLDAFAKIANLLDKRGLYRCADLIDAVLLKAAMNEEQARKLLGLPLDYTAEDIKHSHKQLALQHHPDKGGSVEDMKQLNIAKDVLLERRKPDYEQPTRTHYDPREYQAYEREPQRKEHHREKGWYEQAEEEHEKQVRQERDMWDGAIDAAGVITDADWKLISGVMTGANIKEHAVNKARIVYGIRDGLHVFIGVVAIVPLGGRKNKRYVMFMKTTSNIEQAKSIIDGLVGQMKDYVSGGNVGFKELSEGASFDPSILIYGKGPEMWFREAIEYLKKKGR